MSLHEWPILPILTFLPLLGVLFLLLVPFDDTDEQAKTNFKTTTLWITVVVFALSIIMYLHFDQTNAEYQYIYDAQWLSSGIRFRMGVDGISVLFILLTTGLMPLCILASWSSVTKRIKEYMILFLILESLMIGVFSTLDLLWFYLFFEGGLIPMYLIIGIWGGERRVYASIKFFLYTLLGSLFMLLAILVIYLETGTTNIITLQEYDFAEDMQKYLWLAFFASFAVKMPMWPVHTWLPDAHVEAPTAGSVILAGVLLKMGGYGFLRFSLPMFPIASEYFSLFVIILSVIAVIYASAVAYVQDDIKKLIAYSSVAHMGFVTIGIFSLTHEGIQGALFLMFSHGLVSAALFLCVGVIYDRLHTRDINAFGGLANNMPRYAFVLMIFTMANVGLPGTSGFVGEFLALLGLFSYNAVLAFISAIGIILSAGYALRLYRCVAFGTPVNDRVKAMSDINTRESLIFSPLLILIILFGFFPYFVLSLTELSTETILLGFDESLLEKFGNFDVYKWLAK